MNELTIEEKIVAHGLAAARLRIAISLLRDRDPDPEFRMAEAEEQNSRQAVLGHVAGSNAELVAKLQFVFKEVEALCDANRDAVRHYLEIIAQDVSELVR